MFGLRCMCFGMCFTYGLAFSQLFFDHNKEPTLSITDIFNRTRRAAGDCSLTLKAFLKKEPIFIDDKKQMIRPDVVNKDAVVTIPTGKSVLLACPGRNNWISIISKQSEPLNCKNSKLYLEGKMTSVSDISCKEQYSRCETRVTDKKCGGNGKPGVIVELGFEVSSSNLWLPQVSVCHNIDDMYTYYSSHKVYGHSLEGAVKEGTRKPFCVGDTRLFRGANLEPMYRKDNQVKSLNQILGQGAGNHYINITNGERYFARGHLAPDADFVYVGEQKLTYNIVNAAPQWQRLNNGNWLNKIEKTVRDLAVRLDLTLSVHTGVHGILQLSYGTSGLKPIYLLNTKKTDKNIAVPQVFWKIVQHPVTTACTVVVAHNDIFLTTPPPSICNTIPAPRGWPDYAAPIDRGYYYYCDHNSFKRAVPTGPDVQCSGVFHV